MMTQTYANRYVANIYADGEITGQHACLPDQVAADQCAYDGQRIAVMVEGDVVPAILRGDLYALGTPGTGDPVVELVSGAPDTMTTRARDIIAGVDALARAACRPRPDRRGRLRR